MKSSRGTDSCIPLCSRPTCSATKMMWKETSRRRSWRPGKCGPSTPGKARLCLGVSGLLLLALGSRPSWRYFRRCLGDRPVPPLTSSTAHALTVFSAVGVWLWEHPARSHPRAGGGAPTGSMTPCPSACGGAATRPAAQGGLRAPRSCLGAVAPPVPGARVSAGGRPHSTAFCTWFSSVLCGLNRTFLAAVDSEGFPVHHPLCSAKSHPRESYKTQRSLN